MDNVMETEGFIIDSDAKCDWALEKVYEARKTMEANKATADEILATKKAYVEAWLKQENETAQSTIDFMSAKIAEYSKNKLAEINKGKKKPVHSFNLPTGKVAWKKKADEFSCGGVKCSKDNASLLTIIKNSNPDFVKVETKESCDWAEFKKLLTVNEDGSVIDTSTGEVLPIDVKIGEYELNI